MNEDPIRMQQARELRAAFLLDLCARVQAGEVPPGVAVEALVCAGVDYEGAREAIDAAVPAKPEPEPEPAAKRGPKIGDRVRVVEVAPADEFYSRAPLELEGVLADTDLDDPDAPYFVERDENAYGGWARKVEVIP